MITITLEVCSKDYTVKLLDDGKVVESMTHKRTKLGMVAASNYGEFEDRVEAIAVDIMEGIDQLESGAFEILRALEAYEDKS